MTSPTYGVDLITFYDPSFWGVSSYDDIMAKRQADPKAVWEQIFDALQTAGMTAVEMTFPPADMHSALEAYGSASEFKTELERRGLTLKSGFHMGTGWIPGCDVEHEVEKAVTYAEFLAAAGGDTLVVGPPMRRSVDAHPPFFVDLTVANTVADVAHRVGAATLRRGVKTALHPEANSVFCTKRDIDLILTLTDPAYVFFCPDTAHMTIAGADPVEVVATHRDRVVIAHWKDALGSMPLHEMNSEQVHEQNQQYMCSLGSGIIDWEAWQALYDSTDAQDTRILELDAVPDPVSEMISGKRFAENIGTR